MVKHTTIQNPNGGINIDFIEDNFSNILEIGSGSDATPTASGLVSAFGAASSNEGLLGVYRSSSGARHLILCDGTDYYYSTMTVTT